jgi:DNA-binding MarR family transcriptional regulator
VDARRQDLLALMMPITRELRRVEEAAAAMRGLTMWQYAILSVAADRRDLNQAEAADLLGYSKNRIVADLDHLESTGLLTRRRAADRRANVLDVTERGRRATAAVQAEIHRREDELLAPVPAATRRALVEALRALGAQVRSRR